jgi:hypothetical protein
MAGVDLYRVQTLMGHNMPAMTLRYARLSPLHLRAAVELLDEPGAKRWTAAVQRTCAGFVAIDLHPLGSPL